jgi:putative membrane-bound dehydrogenase-like protein
MQRLFLASVLLLAPHFAAANAQIPHNQDAPPGPPLSVDESLAKMSLPDDLQLDVFACEPDVVNPVAMTFDHRGRVWLLESLEYPRLEPGPGRDRVKILEDRDGDGRADSVHIFAVGLNIPSGIALGYGGAFVANAPDLLFLQDSDGDGVADKREVLLTGFGREDVHELPSALLWGPDGWLYGLNGVFNPSVVHHQGRTHRFTCALWRFHPKTRAFEVFAEGTSNPWGLDYDGEGSFFVSACVIDHLWHLAETGYYHRQAGAYPPHTWKIESIVRHAHQKAAYCGLCWFDSPSLGEARRGRWFMGNIHGGCINSDSIERSGAGYAASPNPDLLAANDAWFMPVSQKVGPDGNLWILDWYDRYHCYQDARRDPEGIDRTRGRIYRLRSKSAAPAPQIDFSALSSDQLRERLDHPNVAVRRVARQLLVERGAERPALEGMALNRELPPRPRMEALWTRVSQGDLSDDFLTTLIHDPDPAFRAWGVRAAGDVRAPGPAVVDLVRGLVRDPDPRVRLQVAVALRKLLPDSDAAPLLLSILAESHDDPSGLLPRIAWRNLEAGIPDSLPLLVAALRNPAHGPLHRFPAAFDRFLNRCLDLPASHEPLAGEVFAAVLTSATDDARRAAAATLFNAARAGSARSELVRAVADRCRSQLSAASAPNPADRVVALGLGLLAQNPEAFEAATELLKSAGTPVEARVRLFDAWASFSHPAEPDVAAVLSDLLSKAVGADRQSVLLAAAKLPHAAVAYAVLDAFDSLAPDERAPALNLLASRPAWTLTLLDAVDAKRIPREAFNANQIRALAERKEGEIRARVESVWGAVRIDGDPKKRQIVAARMRRALDHGAGDPEAGRAVYARVCSQCHRLGPLGYEVGPDIARNGTANLDAFASNVFDPNLVVGRDYQARIVLKADGQVVTGVPVEESPERIVLKIAGGQNVSIPRDDVDEMRRSNDSLMPEGLESQMTEQDFRDLVAFLLRETSPASSP